MEMKNPMQVSDTWPKRQFPQIQDGGRPPFLKELYLNISVANYPISIKFGKRMQISIPSMEIWQKIEFFQIQDGGRTPYWISFLAIYRRLIGRLTRNSKSDEESYTSTVTWPKLQFSKIQDGGRTPNWNSFFGYISAPYWPINAKFGMEMTNHVQIWATWPKMKIFPNSWWRTAANLKTVFAIYVILIMN